VKRALKYIGPHPYNALTNNCEHYASICRNGTHVSFQVMCMVHHIVLEMF